MHFLCFFKYSYNKILVHKLLLLLHVFANKIYAAMSLLWLLLAGDHNLLDARNIRILTKQLHIALHPMLYRSKKGLKCLTPKKFLSI